MTAEYRRKMMDWGSSKISDAIHSKLTRDGYDVDDGDLEQWINQNVKRNSAFFACWDKDEDFFDGDAEYVEIPEGAFVIWEQILPKWNRSFFIPTVEKGYQALKPKTGKGRKHNLTPMYMKHNDKIAHIHEFLEMMGKRPERHSVGDYSKLEGMGLHHLPLHRHHRRVGGAITMGDPQHYLTSPAHQSTHWRNTAPMSYSHIVEGGRHRPLLRKRRGGAIISGGIPSVETGFESPMSFAKLSGGMINPMKPDGTMMTKKEIKMVQLRNKLINRPKRKGGVIPIGLGYDSDSGSSSDSDMGLPRRRRGRRGAGKGKLGIGGIHPLHAHHQSYLAKYPTTKFKSLEAFAKKFGKGLGYCC